MGRCYRLRSRSKLPWVERRAAKKDLRRWIHALIAHCWVKPEGKPLLINEMNRLLEITSPAAGGSLCTGVATGLCDKL